MQFQTDVISRRCWYVKVRIWLCSNLEGKVYVSAQTLVFFIFRQVKQTVQHTISKDSYFVEGQQTDVIK